MDGLAASSNENRCQTEAKGPFATEGEGNRLMLFGIKGRRRDITPLESEEEGESRREARL